MHSGPQIFDDKWVGKSEKFGGDINPIVISPTIQEFDGTRYYFCGGRYYRHKGKLLHRAVWQKNRGPIPKEREIHHKDRNRHNNNIANLDCLLDYDHRSGEHGAEIAERFKPYMGLGVEAAKIWHSSPEGIAWHREHYKLNCAEAMHRRETDICKQCGAEYLAYHTNLFCSNKCKSAWRR